MTRGALVGFIALSAMRWVVTEQAQARICPTCHDDHATGYGCALIWEHPFEPSAAQPDTCDNVRDGDGFVCGFGREVHGGGP